MAGGLLTSKLPNSSLTLSIQRPAKGASIRLASWPYPSQLAAQQGPLGGFGPTQPKEVGSSGWVGPRPSWHSKPPMSLAVQPGLSAQPTGEKPGEAGLQGLSLSVHPSLQPTPTSHFSRVPVLPHPHPC